MDYFYYENNESIKLNLTAGSKWSEQQTGNAYLNTIFSRVDNGDDIVQEKELTVLNKLLLLISKLTPNSEFLGILDNNAMKKVIEQLDNQEIRIEGNNIIEEKLLGDNIAQSGTIDIEYTASDYQKMRTDPSYAAELQNKQISEIKDELKNRYPDKKYHIEVTYDGKYYKYYIYDLSLKKQDTAQDSAADFLNNNPEALSNIEDPILFMNAFKEQTGGETIYSSLLAQFQNGKISKEEFINQLKILERKFEEYEENYENNFRGSNYAPKDNHLKYYGNDYGRIISKLERHFQKQESFDAQLAGGEFTREQIDELKQFVKTEYNVDLTDIAVAELIESQVRNKCAIYDENHQHIGLDLEKFKGLCKTEKFYGESFPDYLKYILCYEANGYNETLESINEQAEIIENEYARYDFDIKTSAIADLVRTSDSMIQRAEKELEITETSDRITIRNKNTGKERVIDLAQITKNLDDMDKYRVINAMHGMNKLTLWEFAIEVKNIGSDAIAGSAGEYIIENDTVEINKYTNTYSLTHEMCHAMMATVIDGENVFNEPLYQEFAETYKEEQAAHKEKGLKQFGASDYNYCSDNIQEFAAEAGCLYLTGESSSKFTIAEHFPKSYRLFVNLIKKIQSQETNRTL